MDRPRDPMAPPRFRGVNVVAPVAPRPTGKTARIAHKGHRSELKKDISIDKTVRHHKVDILALSQVTANDDSRYLERGGSRPELLSV